MARTDLTEQELRELLSWSKSAPVPPRQQQLIQRLAGEVRELREREAASRMLHEQEGEY